MKILAIETATEACSAALFIDGSVSQRYELAPRQHGVLILSMVEQLLADADVTTTSLDVVAFGCGPGSFTGLRIAAAVTQGIAFGADLGVAPVSTLAALANGVMRKEQVQQVLAALDARMDQVYCGAYLQDEKGLAKLQGVEQVCAPEKVNLPGGQGWSGSGSGWDRYRSELQSRTEAADQRIFSDRYPQARDVAELAVSTVASGNTLCPEDAIPVYLRNTVATKPLATNPAK